MNASSKDEIKAALALAESKVAGALLAAHLNSEENALLRAELHEARNPRHRVSVLAPTYTCRTCGIVFEPSTDPWMLDEVGITLPKPKQYT